MERSVVIGLASPSPTNFEFFAKSRYAFSNLFPVSSSLGIGFDETIVIDVDTSSILSCSSDCTQKLTSLSSSP